MSDVEILMYNIGDIIQIKWLDQSSYVGPIRETKGCINKVLGTSIGIFLEHDQEWITFATESFVASNDPIAYRNIVTIPRCCILSLKKLKELEGGK